MSESSKSWCTTKIHVKVAFALKMFVKRMSKLRKYCCIHNNPLSPGECSACQSFQQTKPQVVVPTWEKYHMTLSHDRLGIKCKTYNMEVNTGFFSLAEVLKPDNKLSVTFTYRPPMFGLQPVVPVSHFSLCNLIKSCEHDTKMGVGKRGKEAERKRQRESTQRPSEIYKYPESIKP